MDCKALKYFVPFSFPASPQAYPTSGFVGLTPSAWHVVPLSPPTALGSRIFLLQRLSPANTSKAVMGLLPGSDSLFPMPLSSSSHEWNGMHYSIQWRISNIFSLWHIRSSQSIFVEWMNKEMSIYLSLVTPPCLFSHPFPLCSIM